MKLLLTDQSSGRYYIFGSHKAGAFSTDMQSWTVANPTWQPDNNTTAFTTPAVKTLKKGGVEVSFPQFNAADWSGRNDASFDINGNMWAPDVIWNTSMQKWRMYLSVNGNAFHSSIILLTADDIVGPYVDSQGGSAVYSSRTVNYGPKCDTRGEKLMGVYNNWGEMTVGECSQGHNSIITAPDGRNYLVYDSYTGVNVWGYKRRTVAADWTTGMVAHYGFDDESLSNTFNPSQHAELLKTNDNVVPSLQSGAGRASQYVSLNFGTNDSLSYQCVTGGRFMR